MKTSFLALVFAAALLVGNGCSDSAVNVLSKDSATGGNIPPGAGGAVGGAGAGGMVGTGGMTAGPDAGAASPDAAQDSPLGTADTADADRDLARILDASGTAGSGGRGGSGGGAGGTTPVDAVGTGGSTSRGGIGAGGTRTGGAVGTGGGGGTAAGGATGLDGGVAPTACRELSTQTACDARSDCHSVFEDPGTCGCAAPGCCAHFKSCADGSQADCVGPALCEVATPFCESPYVVSYQGFCYEGCVKESTCAPPACPKVPPPNGSSCSPVSQSASQTCLYEDCGGAGTTLATCTARVWKITTGACAATDCTAIPDSPNTLSCSAGQICVFTRTRSGAGTTTTTSKCVEHTCGTGPVTLECIPSLAGTCTPAYSIVGASVTCEVPAP